LQADQAGCFYLDLTEYKLLPILKNKMTMKKNYILSKIWILTLMFVSIMVYSQPVERTIIYVGQYVAGTTDVSITMEMGVFTNDGATINKWPLLEEDGGIWGYDPPEAVDVQWRIMDDQDSVTKGYSINQIVNYATTAARGVPYLYGLTIPPVILATAARTDGGTANPTFVQDDAIALAYISNPDILIMNVAYTYLAGDVATTDFYYIFHRAVEFMFDAYPQPPIGIDQLSADKINLSILPNPAIDNVTLSFSNEGGKSISVSLISVTGGLIGNIYEGVSVAGNNVININTDDSTPGLYFVKLQIDKSVTYSKLIIK
jgi:hypothetical protein